MAFGDIAGRASVNPSAPRAFGVCDSCGVWHQRNELTMQMDWFGPRLGPTGFYNCYRCLYVPNEQLKPIVLPADPVPVQNPRIEAFEDDEA